MPWARNTFLNSPSSKFSPLLGKVQLTNLIASPSRSTTRATSPQFNIANLRLAENPASRPASKSQGPFLFRTYASHTFHQCSDLSTSKFDFRPFHSLPNFRLCFQIGALIIPWRPD